jgi:superfamily II DNA/RNA helicase
MCADFRLGAGPAASSPPGDSELRGLTRLDDRAPRVPREAIPLTMTDQEPTTEPDTTRTPEALTPVEISVEITDDVEVEAGPAPAAAGGQTPPEGLAEAEDEEFEPLAARAPVLEDSPLFSDFDVNPAIVTALADFNITRTFAIQELTLPIALAGSDLIGQARTGTGKTLGFGVPLLHRITLGGKEPRALVVVPTRELCIQVTRDLQAAGTKIGARCVAIYGGRAYEPQVAALRKGSDVVIGTPGRLLDLLNQGLLKLGSVSVLVLDEADEMLDLGFLPDIERIIAKLPEQRQTMLFSATMPGPIVALARRFMRQPVHIRAEAHDESTIVPTTAQFVYRAHALDKTEMLSRILQARDRGLTMIFCRTKRTAQKVADDLSERGFAAAAVHGDLGQGAREQALRAFRSGKVDVLVATDVAARGLDVENVTHVINYQCPEDEKVYLHRIGRTARAGRSGTAVSFVDWDELPRWKAICDALALPFHEPPETYSTSEHLHIDLDIPSDVEGTLPQARRVRAGLAAEEVEDVGETGRGRHRAGGARLRVRRGESPPRHSRAGGERREGPADGPVDGDEAVERPRRRRARRRTRAGQPLAGEPAEVTAEEPAEDALDDGDDEDPTAEADESTGTARPRRRRRRGGRGRGGSATATAESSESVGAEPA